MRYIRIDNINDPYFEKLWEIYNYSFPLSERRTLEHQIVAFSNPRYHLDCYLIDERIVGFIGYWEFEDYVFIEHYAMADDSRGEGHGTKILGDFIAQTSKTIILEIDKVVDPTTERRLRFYERLNFVRNPYKHICFVYREGCSEEKLEVMSYPAGIDRPFYDRFYADLGNVVMKY